MEIGALLKTFIFLIASSLLYPVLLLLVLLTFWILICAGSFFAEWIERMRLDKYAPAELPDIIRKGGRNALSHRVRKYVVNLEDVTGRTRRCTEVEIENMLQEHILGIWKSLDGLKILVRVAPGLGLIGTLIPMGTGLAALGQGDITKLSSDLVIAFTTTVVGLALGMTAYFFYTVKRRWVEEDIKNIELATELLAGEPFEERE
jgi:biopolymer transport protein ExbB/TolQ